MNINTTLKDKTFDAAGNDLFLKYNCNRAKIEEFLFTPRSFKHRQYAAIDVIEGIFGYHGKKDLIHNLTTLARIEHDISELEEWRRDHVVHALLTFLLGVYIDDKLLSTNVDPLEWKLAGLLHDVAYPAEISHSILSSIPNTIGQITQKLQLDFTPPCISTTTAIYGLDNLQNGVNALDLIQSRISSWHLCIDAKAEFAAMQQGRPCHGMYSALTMLFVLDLMYQKYNRNREYKRIPAVEPYLSWNQSYFDKQIVNACTAVFLHNLPPRCFDSVKIDRIHASLAFLLKLCDTLQDWERPSQFEPSGQEADKYDIEVDSSGLTFHADVDDARRRKIADEILSILISSNINVVP